MGILAKMFSKSIVASALLAGAAYAAPAATVTQISDGQIQASAASKASSSMAAGSMKVSSMASGASSHASQGIYASEASSEYGSQVPAYTGANAPYKSDDASVDLAKLATSFGTNSAVN